MEISLESNGGISWITGPLIPAGKGDGGVGINFLLNPFLKARNRKGAKSFEFLLSVRHKMTDGRIWRKSAAVFYHFCSRLKEESHTAKNVMRLIFA